ncbi:MarR family transcriptional regulator [Devosia sp. J2-20]|uniref:MarR family winged helix-turn-helix transcriptional regulator n=1 Tax=Devosia sp. J2-20 TaxID=3026161 RepID=UPI00249B64CF|nr:MarR family transcriptional regulator [Devosia sp. J2-20]WDQ99319.1 MarR family transcriptional regulator [Devosia sp. J2-20]
MQSDSLRLHYLLHSADLIEDRLHHQLAPLGIKPRQARILDALARMSRASQVELARAFDVSPASMSTMTARLVAAGFITREVDRHDIRSNTLRLSKRAVTCSIRFARPGAPLTMSLRTQSVRKRHASLPRSLWNCATLWAEKRREVRLNNRRTTSRHSAAHYPHLTGAGAGPFQWTPTQERFYAASIISETKPTLCAELRWSLKPATP